MRLLLLLVLLLLQPAPPPFSAHWARPHVARLAWQQPANVHQTCLFRNATLIRCWHDLAAGRSVLVLGNVGPLDAAAHPSAGDTFTLTLDSAVWYARLAGVARLPIVRR